MSVIVGTFIVLVYLIPMLLLMAARSPVVVRGERLASAVIIFAAIDALWMSLPFGSSWTTASTIFWGTHLLTLPLIRSRWILWAFDRDAAATLLEKRMRMLVLRFERSANGYTLAAGDVSDFVGLSALGRGSTMLVFDHGSRRSKVRMLRTLTAKAFRSVYPRPIIQL